MTNKDIERGLKNAVEKSTPNVLENILSQCNEQTGKVMSMKNINRKRIITGIIGFAAALVIIISGAFALGLFDGNNSPDVDNSTTNPVQADNNIYSTITLDVNPSIEINVNEGEKVISVNPLNEDAKKVVGDMDFKGSSLDVAVNAIIGSMVRNGYINELANSILISVDSKNAEKGAALEAKLSKEVLNLLTNDDFTGAVLGQVINHANSLEEKAEQYGITLGKAQLIEKIVTADNRYTFEQLAALSINELNLISDSGEMLSSSMDVIGTASDKKYIGNAKAKEIALNNAGISANSIRDYECELDFEYGKMIYEVSFDFGNYEYEYDIDAFSGKILHSQKEKNEDYNPNSNSNSEPTERPSVNAEYIGKAKAKTIALNHANASAVQQYECELDYENGKAVYEISFIFENMEYDYEIDAVNGKIISSHKEKADFDDLYDVDD